MSCCCVNRLSLCDVNVCDVLMVDKLASAPDSSIRNVYSLMLFYLNSKVVLQQEQVEGQKIKFDVSSLSENFQYEGQLFDSSGSLVTIEANSITYDCLKFNTIMVLNSAINQAEQLEQEALNTVIVESVIGDEPVITGTTEAVEGIAEGSNTVTSLAFVGVRVLVIRGKIPLPGMDPEDGGEFFAKELESDFITFSSPLVLGEFIRIQTIPS